MNRKDILELKRRLKKDECTFTKMCGCYVNGEKKILLEFKDTFLNLPDEDFFKYLEISKKVLSGSVGNNILELNFPINEDFSHEKQSSLIQLKQSGLKNDQLLKGFYNSIIESFDFTGNFLILLFHDVYDIMVKTSDNLKLDESEEVYEYILCAICPVSPSKPGLGYFKEEGKIKARIRDWVVEVPTIGFVYPGFIDRSSDVNTVMYYTKNTKFSHPEFMEKTLGCHPKQTATIQKESFQSLIKSTVSSDDNISEKIFTNIQENLNSMIEEYKDIYVDTNQAPISLSKDKVKSLLIDSGVSDEISTKIENSYEETFGKDLPLAENLIDTKLLKANAHKKKEEALIKQVEVLEEKLEIVKKESDINTSKSDENKEETNSIDDKLNNNDPDNYDVVLHVKPDKISKIKTELINGQRCIVIPIDENEQATINGKQIMKD